MSAMMGLVRRLVIAVLAFAGWSMALAQSAHLDGATAEPTGQASPQRQREVARRGADVMPFNLEATTHVFMKTARGGIQKVVAKDPSNLAQVRLVRAHLREIQLQFEHGNFSGPAHIHGQAMPGLAELQAAPQGAITLAVRSRQGRDGGPPASRRHAGAVIRGRFVPLLARTTSSVTGTSISTPTTV